jgi:hypothetical protein
VIDSAEQRGVKSSRRPRYGNLDITLGVYAHVLPDADPALAVRPQKDLVSSA